jgi:hypothetical protein
MKRWPLDESRPGLGLDRGLATLPGPCNPPLHQRCGGLGALGGAERQAAIRVCVTRLASTGRLTQRTHAPQCSRSRTHIQIVCTGTFPCDRCWRLALPCRPQASRKAAAARNDGGSPDGSVGDEEEEAAAAAADGESAAAASAAASSSSSPSTLALLKLTFARASPRADAELMIQAFMALHADGKVAQERALFAAYVLVWVLIGWLVDRSGYMTDCSAY